MKQLYFTLFLLSTIHMNSQSDRIIFHGIIFNDSLAIDNVNIVNKNTNKGTVSNRAGKFQISVKENDILQFSNIQYQTKKIKVNKTHIQKKVIEIYLIQKTNELQEVVVHNMAKSLGLPNADKEPLQPTERKINYYNKGGMIDKLYGFVSGDSKKLKILQKHLEEDERELNNELDVKMIRAYFKDEFFINTLQVSKGQIDGLIAYCLSKGIVNAFENDRDLEVMDILIQNKEDYLKSIE